MGEKINSSGAEEAAVKVSQLLNSYCDRLSPLIDQRLSGRIIFRRNALVAGGTTYVVFGLVYAFGRFTDTRLALGIGTAIVGLLVVLGALTGPNIRNPLFPNQARTENYAVKELAHALRRLVSYAVELRDRQELSLMSEVDLELGIGRAEAILSTFSRLYEVKEDKR